jgi:hypothetical protein
MSEESPPSFSSSIFNQSAFSTETNLDTEYLNANYVKYPITQTGTITMANLATTNDATINGLTVGTGGGGISSCVALGVSSLGSNTTGTSNTAVGANSLNGVVTGQLNTAVGYNALQVNTASSNTAVGAGSQSSTSSGSQNVSVGRGSLSSNTIGSNNTSVGFEAGYAGTANTTGSNNTFIGYQAQADGSAYSTSTALGAGAIIKASNTIVLGTSAETVRYNKVAPLYTTVPTFTTSDIGYFYSGNSNVTPAISLSGTNVFSVTPVLGMYLVSFNISLVPVSAAANTLTFSIKSGSTVLNISTATYTASANSTTTTPISLQAPVSVGGSTAITVEYTATAAASSSAYYYSILRVA